MATREEVLRFVSRFQSPPVVKSSQGRTSAPRERFRPEIPRAIVRARPVETIVRTRACLSVSYILCYILLTLSFFLAPARRLLRSSSFSWPSLSFSSIFSLRCICFLCLFLSLSIHPSLRVFYSYSFLFFMLSCPYFPSFFLTLILSQHRFASPLETRLSNLFPARMRSCIVAEIPNSLPADDFHSQRERRRDATPRTARRFFARIVHPDFPPLALRITVHRINPIFFFCNEFW